MFACSLHQPVILFSSVLFSQALLCQYLWDEWALFLYNVCVYFLFFVVFGLIFWFHVFVIKKDGSNNSNILQWNEYFIHTGNWNIIYALFAKSILTGNLVCCLFLLDSHTNVTHWLVTDWTIPSKITYKDESS